MSETLPALQAVQAAAARAAADLAAAQLPALEAAAAALEAPGVAELRAALATARAGLSDPLAIQALVNVAMILDSARATVRHKASEFTNAVVQVAGLDA